MKISAAEAQWDTCGPCAMLARPGRRGSRRATRRRASRSQIPPRAVVGRDRLARRPGQGVDRAEPGSTRRCTGPGNYMSPGAHDLLEHARDGLRWQLRGSGRAGRRVPAPGSAGSSGRAGSCGLACVTIVFPLVAVITFGWMLTEIGPAAVDRAGPARDGRRDLAGELVGDADLQPDRVRRPVRAVARTRHLADAEVREADPPELERGETD